MLDQMLNTVCGLLPPPLLSEAATPFTAGPEGRMSYLASDTVLMTIFGCMVLLLLGVLIRMRKLRTELEHETAALKKSESHLRVMGDNLPNITIFQLLYDTADRTFRFSYISKGYERVLGLDRAHIMDDAQLAMDHVYEADIATLKQAFADSTEQMESISIEIRVLDVTGKYKWLHISAIPQRMEELLLWDGFMQDISATKEAQQNAIEEYQNFSHLFETIDDLLIVCDMDGRLQHTNPSIEQRLGFSREEMAGMSIFELYPKEHQEAVFKVVAHLQSDSTATCGFPMQMKSGAIILVEMNLFKGTWKHRPALFGVAHDVARYQQTESALRESQKMLQLIIDSIPMSIFWKDKDSVYLGCNDAFVRESHMATQADVVNKTPYDLFDPETAGNIVERDQGVITANQPQMNLSESHTRPDGSVGWREISLIPLRNETGQAVGVLGVWRDVTEQNRAEDRLKRTLDDMERFNQLMRGRERRTLELKDEINDLLLELGRSKKYRTTSEDMS